MSYRIVTSSIVPAQWEVRVTNPYDLTKEMTLFKGTLLGCLEYVAKHQL